MPLDAAQLAKLEWHATAARVDGAKRVLDVGCGWGAMLRYLVAERSCVQPSALVRRAVMTDVCLFRRSMTILLRIDLFSVNFCNQVLRRTVL